jgi:hypothetical protein
MAFIKVRRKRTVKEYRAFLNINSPAWLPLGYIYIKSLDSDYIESIDPNTFEKNYRSKNDDYKPFLEKAREIYYKNK